MIEKESIGPFLEQIHDGKTHIGEYLSAVFQNLDIWIAWKDCYSVMQGCNIIQSRAIGLQCPDEIIGKNDFQLDMRDEEAERFRTDDQKVIQNGQSRIHDLRYVHYSNGLSTLVSTSKLPVFSHNKQILGVICFAYEIKRENTSQRIDFDNLRNFLSKQNRFFPVDK